MQYVIIVEKIFYVLRKAALGDFYFYQALVNAVEIRQPDNSVDKIGIVIVLAGEIHRNGYQLLALFLPFGKTAQHLLVDVKIHLCDISHIFKHVDELIGQLVAAVGISPAGKRLRADYLSCFYVELGL